MITDLPVDFSVLFSKENLLGAINQEENQLFIGSIDLHTFEFILNETNTPKVKEALLNSLKVYYPEHCNEETADKLIAVMREIAKTKLGK